MDAEVFQGNHELDRSVRSAEKSRRQMEWFTAQLLRLNLVSKTGIFQECTYRKLIMFSLTGTQNQEQRI
jgi:hypothetical protein